MDYVHKELHKYIAEGKDWMNKLTLTEKIYTEELTVRPPGTIMNMKKKPH